MGVGAVSTGVGAIFLAAGSGSSLYAAGLVFGVTVGPILLAVGLVVLIVGAAIYFASNDGEFGSAPTSWLSGAGVASAVGTGCGALWAAISEGRDGLRDIQRFAVDRFQTRLAGLWPGWDGRQQPGSEARLAGTRVLSTSEIAVVAAREARAAGSARGRHVAPSDRGGAGNLLR